MTLRERSPLVLAYLVGDSEQMQKSAAEADAISKLAALLQDLKDSDLGAERLKENTLLAVAALCSLTDDCRKQVCTAPLMH